MADFSTNNRPLSSYLHQQIDYSHLLKSAEIASQKREELGIEYFSLTFSIPKVDALAVLEQHSTQKTFEYYWEKPSDKFSIAAAGEVARIQVTGSNRFQEASAKGKDLLSKVFHTTNVKHSLAVVHLLGGFSFFDYNVSKVWKKFGSSSFTLPQWMILQDGEYTILTVTSVFKKDETSEQLLNRIHEVIYNLDDVFKSELYSVTSSLDNNSRIQTPEIDSPEYYKWVNTVEIAQKEIQKGTFDKIVLAREMVVKLEKPVSDTLFLNRLRQQYPDCYSFLIRQDSEASFISCTPERLATFRNQFILTEGLAGSTSRGKTASEDARLEYDLLHSKKDLIEHSFVLEAIEENLSQYSDKIEYSKIPGVKKLSNVQHLHTPVRAQIRPGVSKTNVLSNLHPTPAVGGFPKEKAVPFISKLEDFDRGWYAAPVGWINANGDGEFAVAIRSGLIRKDEVRFFAGCGIVEDSIPQKEWEETNLKFIPMLSALEYAGK